MFKMKNVSVICIPYAGGNKYSFKELNSFFSDKVNFVTLELPGRGERIHENLLSDLPSMVNDLYGQLEPYLENEYVVYGHSMGGMLGNLLIQNLCEAGEKLPFHFFVSGCRCPANNYTRKMHHLLSDLKFKQELYKLGGIPEEICNSSELMDYFLPILREDFRAMEIYQNKNKAKHSVSITALAGTEECIDEENLNGWSKETSGELKTFWFQGNHFFINSHFKEIAMLIKDVIDKEVRVS